MGKRVQVDEDTLGGYKTIMGTNPKSSSHSPFATEAAYGVRLLLLRPVAFLLPKHYSCNPRRSGPSFYGWTFLLSFCSRLTSGLSGTKCLSGPVVHFPKVVLPVSEAIGPKSSVF